MKKTLFVILMCAMCLLMSCEKHDGMQYFKAKCVAELNGQTYVDQTPFTISPNAIVTPSIYCDDAVRFSTLLRTGRKDDVAFGVDINLFINAQDIVTDREYIIERQDIESLGNEPTTSDYVRYCRDNNVSYADILSYAVMQSEIPSRCSIRFTTFDPEKRQYQGSFTLTFSEGTLKGEFEI